VAKQQVKKEEAPTREDTVSQEALISIEIATLAYHLWEARGCPVGSPEIDWFDAEQRLLNREEAVAIEPVKKPLLVRSSGA